MVSLLSFVLGLTVLGCGFNAPEIAPFDGSKRPLFRLWEAPNKRPRMTETPRVVNGCPTSLCRYLHQTISLGEPRLRPHVKPSKLMEPVNRVTPMPMVNVVEAHMFA